MRRYSLVFAIVALLLFQGDTWGKKDVVHLAPAMAKHIPVYPGAEVMDNLEMERLSLLRLVKVPCDKAARWYLDYFEKKGWKTEMSLLDQLSSKLVFTHPSGRPTLLMDIDYVPPQWTYIHLRLLN